MISVAEVVYLVLTYRDHEMLVRWGAQAVLAEAGVGRLEQFL
jgi:hypothetical protein